MKVGDRVQSKKHMIEGVITEIGDCDHELCKGMGAKELTFDPLTAMFRYYYHVDSFVVIEEKGK